MISSIIVNKDGTVIVFDEEGHRISEYCGQWIRKMEAIVQDAPYDAGWHGYDPARCAVCEVIIEGRYREHMASKQHKQNTLSKGTGQHAKHTSKLMGLKGT